MTLSMAFFKDELCEWGRCVDHPPHPVRSRLRGQIDGRMTQDHPLVRPRRPSRPDLPATRARRGAVVEDATCGTAKPACPRRPEHNAMLTRCWDAITTRPRRGYRLAKKPLTMGGESPGVV